MGGIRLDQDEAGTPFPVAKSPSSSVTTSDQSNLYSNGVLLASLDRSGRVLSLTPGMAKALGVEAKDATGVFFEELVALEQREGMKFLIKSALESSEGSPAKKFNPASEAKRRTEISLMSILLPSQDSLILMIGAAWPMSSNMTSLTTYEMTQQLFSWNDLIAIAVDQEGKVITSSSSVESLTGRLQEDILGKEMVELLEDEASSLLQFRSALAKVLGGEVYEGEVRLLARAKVPIMLRWRMQPIRDHMGKVIGAMGFGHEPHSPLATKAIEDRTEPSLEVLAETSTDIVESDDLAEAIEKDLDKLIDSLGVDFAVFRLVGRESKPRMVCAGLDFRRGRMLLESHLIGEGPLYRGVQNGAPFISMDTQTDPRIVLEDKEIRSVICLPIRFRGEIYGCGAFGSMRSAINFQSKLPVLQVFCNQVAISMRKVKLKDELALKNMELESLYETSMAVSSSLDMQKVLSTILSRASDLVKADAVYLFQMDKNTTNLHLISSISPYGNVVDGLVLRVGEGITGLVAQTREGMLIERADKDSRSVQVPGTPDDPSSLISVPLKMGDELLGVVTLERVPGIPFNENEFRLIQLFSFQAATAIHNALMFNRLNEHASSQQMYNILLTHDVANYNVPIHGYLEMLAKDPKLDERQRRFVKSSLAQSENISSLIADVRKLSLLRTMESVKSFEPIDLPKIIVEVLESIRQNILYEDTDVHFHPVAGQVLVSGDVFIKDVVYNLISNACKHAGDAPIDVVIKEYDENGTQFWRMDVKDQGGGISEDRKAFLFRRFESVDADSASEGHGIGLSVVSALCERFGGRVWVEDRESLDGVKGSIFAVTFPRVKV